MEGQLRPKWVGWWRQRWCSLDKSGSTPVVLILGVCTPLIVLCNTFSVINSAVSFPGWSGNLWLLCYTFSLVCFICLVETFVPRVFSLQSLTLGTKSVLCSFPFNLVSDTGYKCVLLWIIWTGRGSSQVQIKVDKREGQRFGQRLALARVVTNWIQWQGQWALIPCIGSNQTEMETEMDKEQE